MHAATFAAFKDELIKIATKLMSPEDADRLFGSHAQRVANVEAMASKFHKERGIPESVPQGQGTVVARPKPGPPVPTGVHQAPSGMTQTHVRPASVVGHAPAAVPHPAAVPGGGAGLLRRGAGMARAHAAPLAIGAGVATMGAMALSKMRQQNAPSR